MCTKESDADALSENAMRKERERTNQWMVHVDVSVWKRKSKHVKLVYFHWSIQDRKCECSAESQTFTLHVLRCVL